MATSKLVLTIHDYDAKESHMPGCQRSGMMQIIQGTRIMCVSCGKLISAGDMPMEIDEIKRRSVVVPTANDLTELARSGGK